MDLTGLYPLVEDAPTPSHALSKSLNKPVDTGPLRSIKRAPPIPTVGFRRSRKSFACAGYSSML